MGEQIRRTLKRRSFLKGAAAFSASAIVSPPLVAESGVEEPQPQMIAEISMDLHRIHKWDTSNGDTWDPFWAEDDSLYAFNCMSSRAKIDHRTSRKRCFAAE